MSKETNDILKKKVYSVPASDIKECMEAMQMHPPPQPTDKETASISDADRLNVEEFMTNIEEDIFRQMHQPPKNIEYNPETMSLMSPKRIAELKKAIKNVTDDIQDDIEKGEKAQDYEKTHGLTVEKSEKPKSWFSIFRRGKQGDFENKS